MYYGDKRSLEGGEVVIAVYGKNSCRITAKSHKYVDGAWSVSSAERGINRAQGISDPRAQTKIRVLQEAIELMGKYKGMQTR